jgi:hypothetical protein
MKRRDRLNDTWYIQHSKDKAKVVAVQELSPFVHRNLMIDRYKYPDLVVVFNERLQYQLAKRIDRDDSYVLLTTRKEQYHGTQGKSRRDVRKPRRIPTDEEPA